MYFVQVKYPDTTLLQQFIDKAGVSLQSFRYFKTRTLEVIKNHACTFLLMDDTHIPVSYGHLDKENETIWLGIVVTETYIGCGYGVMMMRQLIDFAKENNIPIIKLSVDNSNKSAIKLYEKLGFVLLEKKETLSFYSLSVKN